MPLFWLSIAFLLGIMLGARSSLPTDAWLILSGASLLLLPLSRSTNRLFLPLIRWLKRVFSQLASRINNLTMRIGHWLSLGMPFLTPPSPALLLCFLFLGAARYQFDQPAITPAHIAWYNDQNVKLVVEGRLLEPPDERDQFTYLRLKVARLHPEEDFHSVPVRGLLLARVAPGGDWHYGDIVRLTGYLEAPFSNESFDYRDYLAHQNIYSLLNNARGVVLQHNQGSPLVGAIYDFRAAALARVYRFFPDPEASLLAGILLGVRTGIPEQVDEAFRLTGTSHVIAISGFNITILAGLFTFLFRRLVGRKRGLLLTILAVIFYTIMVGASAAVVRAAILAVFSLFGRQVGRRQTGLNSLTIIAAGMALLEPGVLWDIGFQLSFAATLGLILYADLFMAAFTSLAVRVLPPQTVSRIAGAVGAYLLFTLAAQLTTLPLILHYTGILSLSALLANPLILPAQPPLMIMGGIATLVGLLSTFVGQALAWTAWPFLAFTIRTVEWLANLPGGVMHLGRLETATLLIYYAALFGWSLWRWFKRKEEEQTVAEHPNTAMVEEKLGLLKGGLSYFRQRPWLPLMGLGIMTLVTWRAVLSAPDGRLYITIFDVGSGEGILIRTPAGHQLLVNGGPSGLTLADALGRRLPPTGRSFDWWVIANTDEEGIAGLSTILARYPPDRVLWSGPTHGSYTARRLWGDLNDAGLPVSLAETGMTFDLDGGVSLSILDSGKRGATLLLEWKSFRLLLPIGTDFEAIERLEPHTQPVTAMLLSESGYAPLNPASWLEKLDPQLVLLSVAADDRQGLPDAEVLEALQDYTVMRTDQNGWIELTTDGEQLWVEVERR